MDASAAAASGVAFLAFINQRAKWKQGERVARYSFLHVDGQRRRWTLVGWLRSLLLRLQTWLLVFFPVDPFLFGLSLLSSLFPSGFLGGFPWRVEGILFFLNILGRSTDDLGASFSGVMRSIER